MSLNSEAKRPRILFAPAMTGHLHLGEARLAVLSWALARAEGGTLILLARSGSDPAVGEVLLADYLDDLRWLGLSWEEGPDVGGPYGPYLEWQRTELYREKIGELARKGLVYPCYCTSEELRAEREKQLREGLPPRYSGRCRSLDEASREKLRRSRPHRFRVDVQKAWQFVEASARKRIEVQELDDFPVSEPGGEFSPTFRAAVDAGALRIDLELHTWDARLEAERKGFLMRLLGFEPPQPLFVAPLLGTDGMPLSERHGPVTVRGLREMGYVGEAVRAYFLELEGVRESGQKLDVRGLRGSAGREEGRQFSSERLRELNAERIRAMPPDDFRSLALDYLRRNGIATTDPTLERWLEVVRDRVSLLSDLVVEVAPLFEDPDLGTREARSVLERTSAEKVLWSFYRRLEAIEELSAEAMREIMRRVGAETGLLGRELWDPVRLALVGKTEEPKIAYLVELLGKETCKRRIRRALGAE